MTQRIVFLFTTALAMGSALQGTNALEVEEVITAPSGEVDLLFASRKEQYARVPNEDLPLWLVKVPANGLVSVEKDGEFALVVEADQSISLIHNGQLVEPRRPGERFHLITGNGENRLDFISSKDEDALLFVFELASSRSDSRGDIRLDRGGAALSAERATLLLREDFDANLTGWTTSTQGGGGVACWGLFGGASSGCPRYNFGGTSYTYGTAYSGGGFLATPQGDCIGSSDTCIAENVALQAYSTDARVYSPDFSVAGLSEITIEFRVNMTLHNDPDDFFEMGIQTGGTDIPIYQRTSSTGAGCDDLCVASWVWVQRTVPAATWGSNSSAAVYFRFDSDFNFRSSGAQIDVLRVVGEASSLPTVSVSPTDAYAGEPLNNGTYRVSRTSTSGDLWVNITMSGTATNGVDYTQPGGGPFGPLLVITSGNSYRDAQLVVVDDSLVEGSETATMNLLAGSGYTVVSPSSATITITDDDSPPLPTVSIAPLDSSAGEPSNNGSYRATRSSSSGSLSVNISMSGSAANGADYSTIGSTLVFSSGSSTRDFSLNVINDSLVEGNETATVNLLAGSGYTVVSPSSATITITDDDNPPADAELANGELVGDSLTSSTLQGTWKYYYADLDPGNEAVVFDLFNLTADLDLYVRHGAKPTLVDYDCRPYAGVTTSEQCSFLSPSSSRWWVGVNNWDVGTISYSIRGTWLGSSLIFQNGFESGDLSLWSTSPPGLSVCYLDTACSAGNLRSVRSFESGNCVPDSSCGVLWKCAQGPTLGTCGGGVQECAFSPGCSSDTQTCSVGYCTSLSNCFDQIRFANSACP